VALATQKGVVAMSKRIPGQIRLVDTAPLNETCPSWCVAPHGLHQGEEDWVHTSEPMVLADRVLARICMSVDPDGQNPDGPIVLIGTTEMTPAEANDVGLALQALASAAKAATPRAAYGRRSPGP
jgi:hypothetical protein